MSEDSLIERIEIMPLQEGQTYRFDPPLTTIGFRGEGDDTKQFPNMQFAIGRCVKIGTHAHEFRGEIQGCVYKFFAIPEQGGSKMTPVEEP